MAPGDNGQSLVMQVVMVVPLAYQMRSVITGMTVQLLGSPSSNGVIAVLAAIRLVLSVFERIAGAGPVAKHRPRPRKLPAAAWLIGRR